MMSSICSIIIDAPVYGDKMILGKSCLDWVKFGLGDSFCCVLPPVAEAELVQAVKPHVDQSKEFCVVLYADTPLLTRKTVLDAVATLINDRLNVLKMTRGLVFRTEHLLKTDKLYAPAPYFFEEEDFLTVFSNKQLALATEYQRLRILSYHMERGVTIVDMASTFIDCDVSIGEGVTIDSGNHLVGKTKIGNNVTLRRDNTICGSIVGDGASILRSEVTDSVIGERTVVGPFANIRPHSIIEADCRIGDFVEIKNSSICRRTKICHHAYVGDAYIGVECNIGAGVIFANYDGANKSTIVVGDRVFVGSNSCLIAPLAIDSDSFIAAGSTINKNVPQNALAIARQKQLNKLDWKRPTKRDNE